jgi:hypothetical protein
MRHLVLLTLAGAAALPGAGPVVFNRDVLPVLSDKCFICHGPDAAAKKIPFRLDSEAAAKPKLTELVRRVSTDNKTLRMPPVYSGLSLSPREIEILTTWVADGGKWQQHWSFIPPQMPAAPQVKNPEWVRNPIDTFVLARLEREGLAPSPEASREKLLRRVSLDLTGLPPTPAELDAFLKDSSAKAYEKAVDRLLASPRYGERMAARWMDAARYADSNGYQYDAERIMWRWRDWVIGAFNRNQPFDRFTVEQLAGDLLPNATLQQKIATGFNRNHRANTEDGIVAEEYAVEYVVDRVETASTVFMGVTLGCARCHNHKYDPFTQKEFYQMFAYFNNVPELGRAMKYGNSPPMIAAPTDVQQAALDRLQQKMQTLQAFLGRKTAAMEKAQAVWEKTSPPETALHSAEHWGPPNGLETSLESFSGNTPRELPGVAGFDIEDRFTLSTRLYAEPGPDGAPDGSLLSRMEDQPKGKGYGVHLDHGRIHVNLTSNWIDDAIRAVSEDTLAPRRWYKVTVTYSGSRMAEGLHLYIDGKPARLKIENDTLYRPFRNAGRPVTEPFRVGGGWGPERRFQGQMEDIRVYRRALTADEIVTMDSGEQAALQARRHRYFLENAAAPEIRAAWAELLNLRQQQEDLERTFPTVMVMAEQPVRRNSFVLQRGQYNMPGDKVEPGVPAVLPPLPANAPANRLGLAEWLTDPKNPLLARVTVNRFWQMYFGTGIVKTTEDFGRQGEFPSHPELLDWLATTFVQSGWDVKAMQKLIVTSAAYRQASQVTPELQQKDPENRLLARGPRSRLPAEMIRDQALYDAGLLVEKTGGPSVKPYQPAGLWKEIGMQDMDYTQGQGDDLYRRSLYTFWKRTVAPPMLSTFDAALRESCTVRETRTNTPLQALNLMNDVTFLEAGRFIGQRMMKEGGQDPESRLRYGFRLVTGRAATSAEAVVLLDNYRFHLDYFSTRPEQLAEYLKQGDKAADPGLDRKQLAAYAAVGSLLLNLDETITRE